MRGVAKLGYAVEDKPIRMGLVEISSLRTHGKTRPIVRSATWAINPGSSPGAFHVFSNA